MEMSTAEIKRSYEQAKNKKQQICILADLNCCRTEEIEKILAVEQRRNATVEEKAKISNREPKLSEIKKGLFDRLDELESQIKMLEEEYQKVTIAIDVLGKVEVEYGKRNKTP